jgi:hypothetical protein
MTAIYNPQAAADKARTTYRNVMAQLGLLGLDTAIPGAVRSVAEKTVAQTCEVYDCSRDALDASIATFEDLSMRRGRAQQRSTEKSSTSPGGT